MVTVWMQGGIRAYTIRVTLHAQLFKSRSGLHEVCDALFEGEASCIYTKNCCVCRCKEKKAEFARAFIDLMQSSYTREGMYERQTSYKDTKLLNN